MHDDGFNNSFITLTYSDQELPENGCLKKSDFQKFIKRLRKKTKAKIRYYMCGEYGDKTNRPHFHAILFGYQFPDAKFFCERKGNRIYKSELLEKTWGLGLTELGSVTYKSAGYVARYLIKKQNTQELIQDRYIYVEPETGEMKVRPFEYTGMSLKPGIGKSFYEKYPDSFFPRDFCLTPEGRKVPVPEYYRKLLEKENPKLHAKLQKRRVEKAKTNPNNTEQRLAVRERNAIKNNREQQPRDYL